LRDPKCKKCGFKKSEHDGESCPPTTEGKDYGNLTQDKLDEYKETTSYE